jgi:hypothetical protein
VVIAQEHDVLDIKCRKLARLLGISPEAITWKIHFEEIAPRLKANDDCDFLRQRKPINKQRKKYFPRKIPVFGRQHPKNGQFFAACVVC